MNINKTYSLLAFNSNLLKVVKESFYIPLFIKSEYSIGESIIKLDVLIQRAKSMNMKVLALADRTLAGVLEFYSKCKANDIKPIIGQKVCFSSTDIILLCKDFEAYKILCRHSLDFESQIGFLDEIPFTKEECDHFICITEEYDNPYLQQVFGSDLYSEKEFNKLAKNEDYVMDQIHYIFPENYFDSYEIYKRILENLPKFEDDKNLLIKLVEEGIQKRNLERTPELVSRMKFELKDTISHNLINLFLIHWELTSWCRENNIAYGPGRGTVGGSLVAYLLQITDINPLEYGLLYECFVNPNRISYPDFDIDYDYEHVDEVIRHLKEKYGKENVARIAAYGRLNTRTALLKAGKVLGFTEDEINPIVNLIPSSNQITIEKLQQKNFFLNKYKDSEEHLFCYIPCRNGKKIKKILRSQKYKKLVDIAKEMEGLVRNRGLHACGYIITKEPVCNYAPVLIDSKSGELYCEYPADEIDLCGLYKNDILGLMELSKFEKIKKLTGFDYHTISLDDKKTINAFAIGKTNDVFQFESIDMRKILLKFKPEKFEDLVALNSLYRPGLMNYIPKFIEYKLNPETIYYPDPCFKDILKETYGIIVYKEQFLKIVQKIAGLSLGEADLLHRAMVRKDPEILLQKKKDFVECAIREGFAEQSADIIFESLVSSAVNCYNKSHAVAYTKMAFWDMYLKIHFEKEYEEVMNEILNKWKRRVEK